MSGTEEVILSIIIISTISNLLVDIFGEVALEYGVHYTREFFPNFSIPGFGPDQASAAMDGTTLQAVIDQLTLTPQLIDKLSVEQLELLKTMLVSMQVTS